MSNQSIIQFGHPTLRKVAQKIGSQEFNSIEINKLCQDLSDSLPENGVGLAAPQINVSKRIFIANLQTLDRSDEDQGLTLCLNPEIISSSAETSIDWEGCLSAPGWWGQVERPEIVDVAFYDQDGNRCERKLSGLPARVFQHELDHINGILYTDRMADPSKVITDEEFDKLQND